MAAPDADRRIGGHGHHGNLQGRPFAGDVAGADETVSGHLPGHYLLPAVYGVADGNAFERPRLDLLEDGLGHFVIVEGDDGLAALAVDPRPLHSAENSVGVVVEQQYSDFVEPG